MRQFPYIAMLASLLLSLGCSQIVEIDLPEHDPQLVVNLTFSTDSIWAGRVTLSQNLEAAGMPVTPPGTRLLIEENGLVIDTLVHAQGDTFLSSAALMPIPGHTYTVHASAPGYADVSCTETVPLPAVVGSVSYRDSAYVDQYGTVNGEFKFALDDPAGIHNYYMLAILELDTVLYDQDTSIFWGQSYVTSQDPQLEYFYGGGSLLIDDATFDGRHREFNVQVVSYYDDPMVRKKRYFILSAITPSYYLYQKTLTDFMNANGNPFAEPVRVYSNMPGGMGIFAGTTPRVILML